MGETNTNTNTNTTATLAANLPVWRWNSPTPYLFSAVVILMGLIAAALLMLACSNRNNSDEARPSGSDQPHIGWEVPVVQANAELDTNPKIVVIMAGDDKPTFFAAPTQIQTQVTSFSHICTCGSQV